METGEWTLRRQERAVFDLRALYAAYGYSQYKMSKFEEYDLYVRNKSFLISDQIITFNGTDGRLLALKPDVTLSIVKNTADALRGVQKVYYHENVYRTSAASQDFREIPQLGLECLGDIDDYQLFEVLLLAARSLGRLSPDFVLEISHLDVISAVLCSLGLSDEQRAQALGYVGEKNAHDAMALCRAAGVPDELSSRLERLITTAGEPAQVMAMLSELADGAQELLPFVRQLRSLLDVLEERVGADRLRLDLSLISDMNYYNGIVFRGYLKGVPTSVLSGGQYDGLMQKMGKRSRAVGFAVYLDGLQALSEGPVEYDVDTVLLYGEDAPLGELTAAVGRYEATGERVLACRSIPEGLRYRRAVRYNEEERA